MIVIPKHVNMDIFIVVIIFIESGVEISDVVVSIEGVVVGQTEW